MNLGKGHADQAHAAHGPFPVVGDVLVGGQIVLGHAGAVARHDHPVADLDVAQSDRFEQRSQGVGVEAAVVMRDGLPRGRSIGLADGRAGLGRQRT